MGGGTNVAGWVCWSRGCFRAARRPTDRPTIRRSRRDFERQVSRPRRTSLIAANSLVHHPRPCPRSTWTRTVFKNFESCQTRRELRRLFFFLLLSLSLSSFLSLPFSPSLSLPSFSLNLSIVFFFFFFFFGGLLS